MFCNLITPVLVILGNHGQKLIVRMDFSILRKELGLADWLAPGPHWWRAWGPAQCGSQGCAWGWSWPAHAWPLSSPHSQCPHPGCAPSCFWDLGGEGRPGVSAQEQPWVSDRDRSGGETLAELSVGTEPQVSSVVDCINTLHWHHLPKAFSLILVSGGANVRQRAF